MRAPPLSTRTRWNLSPNPLTAALDARRAAGATWIDLTASNPTLVGLSPSAAYLTAALATPAAARYEPDPRGIAVAREAVCAYYRDRGDVVSPARVTLTASTSEAYGWLFKLLCDPGDDVLVAHPSYPLFDELARLEGVALRPFALDDAGGWSLDLRALEDAITSRTRAVLLVHPNNPTGHYLTRDERDALVTLCAARGLALVVDEVFLDWAWRDDDATRAASFASVTGVLTFTLSGLSKVCALPQLKLGWIVTSGPDALVAEALARLEMVADCYLSVGAPVQHAAPALLDARHEVLARGLARVRGNRETLAEMMRGDSAATLLRGDGGWYGVVRVPRTQSEDAWVLALADEAGVLVQPGWFYDFAREGYLVLSLLPDAAVFREGVTRLLRVVG